MIHIRRLAIRGFKQIEVAELDLPRRGSFLVQGLNESGKSTLFEAVYFALFGRPLVAESGHGGLDAVIPYGQDEARVRLEVTLEAGRRLRIDRLVRRDRSNVWQLDVVAGGSVEEVRGNAVVNARVAAELRLDGEALLNTCFVEQKKLDRLEGLHRSQREQSLMKLLNLDRLVALGEELRVRQADHADLARLRDRAQLAAFQAELPALDRRLAAAAADLERAALARDVEAAIAGADALAALAVQRERAAERAKDLGARATRAEAFAASLRLVAQGRSASERWREAEAAAARTAGEAERARAARDERRPQVVVRGRALRRLQGRLRRLAALEAEATGLAREIEADDARLTDLAREREELNDVRRRLVEARGAERDALSDAEALVGDARAFEVRAALADWLDERQARSSLGDAPGVLTAAEAARATARRRALVETAGLAVLAAFAFALSAGRPAVAIVAAALLLLAAARGLLAWRRLAGLAEGIARMHGEAAVRDRERAAIERREAVAAARLSELRAVLPSTAGRGEAALAEIDDRLGDRSRSDVEEALVEARTAAVRASEAAGVLERRQQDLLESAGRADAAALGRARDAKAARQRRLVEVVDRWRQRFEADAATLGVPADPLALEGELGALRGELIEVRRLAGDVPGLDRRLEELRAEAARHRSAARAAVAEAARGAGGEGRGAVERDPDDGAWQTLEAELRQAYESAGGDRVREDLEVAVREAGSLEGRHADARAAWAASAADLAARVAALGPEAPDLPPDPGPADLEAARVALSPDADSSLEVLARERDRTAERRNVVRHEIDRLGRALGLAGTPIASVEAEKALAEAERAIAVRARGAELVAQAGRNVMQHVLPSTLQNMRLLLPELTGGRYFDAQLTDDYRIEVYDDRAGAWKKKDIFSGGTRDQLSLALRLAFALATLPEERGTAPSFLFLDEPLGAFDQERAAALIELLTAGTLADSFDQVFLVSHVPVPAERFDYRIRLDAGRVVESTLPEADSGETPEGA